VEAPDDALIWEGIRPGLQQNSGRSPGKRRLIMIRNIAATLILLLSMGYVIIDLMGPGSEGKQVTLADIDRDLGDREDEYRSMVHLKFEEAEAMNQADNPIIAELYGEIRKLDAIYQATLKDLNELGNNEQAIETIFDTYEKKIYLLELIILENNKSKIYENNETLYLLL